MAGSNRLLIALPQGPRQHIFRLYKGQLVTQISLKLEHLTIANQIFMILCKVPRIQLVSWKLIFYIEN